MQAHTTRIRPSRRACAQILSKLGLVFSSVRRFALRSNSQLIVNCAFTAVRLQRDEGARELVGGRVWVAVERLALREDDGQAEHEKQGDDCSREAQRAVHLGRDQRLQADDDGGGGDCGEEVGNVVVSLLQDLADWSWQMLDKQLDKSGRDGENWRRRRRRRRHS